MKQVSFGRVILNNIKCAFCRKKSCSVRFLPERKKYTLAGGTRIATYCEKDWNKKMNRKLP